MSKRFRARRPVVLHVECLERRDAPAAGQILREVWVGVAGTTVADLTSSAAFAGPPATSTYLAGLQTPTGGGPVDSGERLRGAITAPQTGWYTFWVAADAEAQV